MSSSVNILDFYRQDAPRGLFEWNSPITWLNASQNSITIQPDEVPNWVYVVKEIKILNKNVVWNETTPGNGLIDILYPAKDGSSVETYVIKNSDDELYLLAEKTETIPASPTVHTLTFRPGIVLDRSLTNNTLTIQPNSNVVDIITGEIIFHIKYWKLLSSEF